MANYKKVDADQLDRAIQATADALKEKRGDYSTIDWNSETGFADAVNGMGNGDGLVQQMLTKYLQDGFPTDAVSKAGFIGAYSFYYMNGLGDVVIPDTVSTIDERAFAYSSITSMYIPDTTKWLGVGIVAGCRNLVSIRFPREVEQFFGETCYWCEALTSVELPQNITVLPTYIFMGCTSLETVDLPETLTQIEGSAFWQSGISSLTIPSTVTSIGAYCFASCSNLKSLELPPDIAMIEGYTFESSGIETIVIPDAVTRIGWYAFANCTNLKSIELSASLEDIQNNVFMGCTSLTAIELPDTLKWISENVFWGCTALKNITIPESVESIGWNCFEGCSAIEYIVVRGDTIRTFDPWAAFSACPTIADKTASIYIEPVSEDVDVDALVEQYKADGMWANFADIIKPITELNTEEVTQ